MQSKSMASCRKEDYVEITKAKREDVGHRGDSVTRGIIPNVTNHSMKLSPLCIFSRIIFELKGVCVCVGLSACGGQSPRGR